MFPFLKLPSELRIMIYRLALTNTPNIHTHELTPTDRLYLQRTAHKLLVLNQQIHTEVLPIWANIFSFPIFLLPSTIRTRIYKHHLAPTNRKSLLPPQFRRRRPHVPHDSEYRLASDIILVSHQLYDEVYPLLRFQCGVFEFWLLADFRDFVASLSASRKQQVKSVKLFYHRDTPDRRRWAGARKALEVLGELRGLDVLEVGFAIGCPAREVRAVLDVLVGLTGLRGLRSVWFNHVGENRRLKKHAEEVKECLVRKEVGKGKGTKG